jgi:hypothetical protein
VVVSLPGELWRSFDAFGRRLLNFANPVLGSRGTERKMLEEAARQRKAKEQTKG